MDIKEATEWLDGERSMINRMSHDPAETWQVRLAQTDAAMTQQAYWIAKAHNEFKKDKEDNLIDMIRIAFHAQLETKTSWGRNELKAMFEAVLESVT